MVLWRVDVARAHLGFQWQRMGKYGKIHVQPLQISNFKTLMIITSWSVAYNFFWKVTHKFNDLIIIIIFILSKAASPNESVQLHVTIGGGVCLGLDSPYRSKWSGGPHMQPFKIRMHICHIPLIHFSLKGIQFDGHFQKLTFISTILDMFRS